MTAPYDRVLAAVRRFTGSSRTGPGGGGTAGLLRVQILDDDENKSRGVDRMFAAFEATVDDFPDVLRAGLPAIRAAHRQVFATEGSAGRGQWEGLAQWTREERARLGYGPDGPILVRTGALREHVLSAPAEITRIAGGVELRIEPDRMVAGVPKYAALAKGYAPNNLPGRPMVAIGPAAAAAVTSAIQRALRTRAQSNGLL